MLSSDTFYTYTYTPISIRCRQTGSKHWMYNVSHLSTVDISCLTNLVSSTDVDERTLSDSWIHSISDLELWYSSCQRRDKPVMNAFLDEQSVSTDACLQHTSTCRLHLTCQSNWTDARLQHTSTRRLHLTCQSNCTDRRTSTAHEHLQTASHLSIKLHRQTHVYSTRAPADCISHHYTMQHWQPFSVNFNVCNTTLLLFIMSHIVESCPLTKLNGGLSRLHSADDSVSWLTNYS